MSESFGQIRGNEFNDFRISKPNHNNLVQQILPMKFDQFATWNRILPPEEINQAFNQGMKGSPDISSKTLNYISTIK